MFIFINSLCLLIQHEIRTTNEIKLYLDSFCKMVKLKSIFVGFLMVCLNDNCKGIKTEMEVPEEFVRTVMSVFFQVNIYK